jgi:hypothetical protein
MSTITRVFLTNSGSPGLVSKNAVYAGDTPTSVSGIPLTAPTNPATGPSFSNVTFCLHVGYLDPGITVSFALQSYVGSSTFDPTPVVVKHFLGPDGIPGYPLNADGTDTCAGAAASVLGAVNHVVRVPWHDMVDLRIGIANAKLRLDLVGIHTSTGYTTNHVVQYEAWIEY